MLQQTTVAHVVTRFSHWMNRFPTLESLACSDETEVLSAWEGLGYYNRARNLWRAAQTISSQFGGAIPADYKILKSLPGIGDYTASAIMAIAFDKPVPALDVNVRRVLFRYLPKPEKDVAQDNLFRKFLERSFTHASPRLLTEAIMELGQVICLPRRPSCAECPLNATCRSVGLSAEETGFLRQSPKMVRRTDIVFLAIWNGSVLLCKSGKNLFQGMWLLPAICDTENRESAIVEWSRNLGLSVTRIGFLPSVKHLFTSNVVTLQPVFLKVVEISLSQSSEFSWIQLTEIDRYPMPSAHRKIISHFLSSSLSDTTIPFS